MINNEILFKPNSLILAKALTADDTVTSSEFKLYDTLLQRCQITKDSHWRKAELTREEIKSIIKNTNTSTVEEIKSTLDKFVKINIKFKLGKKAVSATLIAEHVYDPETDTFVCSMSENVYTALMSCNEMGYSPIDLKLVRQAKGFYTQKIYGILRKWSRYNETVIQTYTVQEIKDVCDIFEGTAYDLYGNLKKKVLVPALKEINSKLNMKVEYKEIKKMRKVQEIEFTITDYEPRKYKFDKDKIIQPTKYKVSDDIADILDEIDSVDYMNLIDLKIKESKHVDFLKDFPDYKNYLTAVEESVERTLNYVGGKTVNKGNYNYFKSVLDTRIPSDY